MFFYSTCEIDCEIVSEIVFEFLLTIIWELKPAYFLLIVLHRDGFDRVASRSGTQYLRREGALPRKQPRSRRA